ncbi:MAG: sugar phosphate isomerase/epimerase [Patescibacteria group bacterium]|nr:sugar phosphate isomerase/epimerase [Patescibacteria group bacterium]
MTVGLHFWGHLPDQTWTNIALPNPTIVEPSMRQLMETIDIAAAHGCAYVLFHPSNRMPVKIDIERQTFTPVGDPIPEEQAQDIFLHNLSVLHKYAQDRRVILAVETIPSRDTNGWYGSEKRNNPFNIYSLDNTVVVKAAERGFTVANDFGHTTCTVRAENRSYVWSTLVQMTKKLFHQTKILHLGYVIPPYNGTDFHDHLDNPLFETDDAVPNRHEMIELLRLFKDRNDVYALVEPDGRHVENYLLAKKMLEEL